MFPGSAFSSLKAQQKSCYIYRKERGIRQRVAAGKLTKTNCSEKEKPEGRKAAQSSVQTVANKSRLRATAFCADTRHMQRRSARYASKTFISKEASIAKLVHTVKGYARYVVSLVAEISRCMLRRHIIMAK